ncbi:diadenylate cyclase CdaA, partial [bacterium]|nr:diadenylate cyclase CdaA [bacterium]
FFIAQKLELHTINWILTKIFAFSVIAFLIIFQPELRRVLAKIGQNTLFIDLIREESMVTEIAKAAGVLAKKKIGALIIIERKVGLRNYIENGIALDSKITSELLINIFMPNTPLHDGAVIIQGERMAAACCLLPLTNNPDVSKSLGTRHRAAMGVTEETDSVGIVVSEQVGIISLVIGGKITRDLDSETLKSVLSKEILKEQVQKDEDNKGK